MVSLEAAEEQVAEERREYPLPVSGQARGIPLVWNQPLVRSQAAMKPPVPGVWETWP